ncbi:MAG: hypothetical protein AAF903_15945 [Pseudomonadota bacterium]
MENPIRRSIIESAEFSFQLKALGDYRAFDEVLSGVIEALVRNPYGFEIFESDLFSFRYIRTLARDSMPALIITFTIDEDKNVVLQAVYEQDSLS